MGRTLKSEIRVSFLSRGASKSRLQFIWTLSKFQQDEPDLTPGRADSPFPCPINSNPFSIALITFIWG